MNEFLDIAPEVATALSDGRAVVALESTIIAHGMPYPQNLAMARAIEGIVRGGGAVPATIAIIGGRLKVGLDAAGLELLARADGVAKASTRDIAYLVATRGHGATTVAATMRIAALAGIPVFATGGIGGVHRDSPFDESADLAELARTPIVVVCAGGKSILDLPATWERLESLGIPVVGYRTSELPGFYTAETGIALDARADNAADAAAVFRAHQALGRRQALLVVQPPPAQHRLPREDVERAVAAAQLSVAEGHVRGGEVTPFLLSAVTRLTGGSSLRANLALLEQNAALAAEIAVALAAIPDTSDKPMSG